MTRISINKKSLLRTAPIGTLVTLIFSILFGVLISIVPWEPLRLEAVILTIFIFFVLFIPVFYLVVLRRQSILQPITVFSIVAFGYVSGSIYLLTGGQSGPFSYRLTELNFPHFVESLLYILVGVSCFQVGYLVTLKGKVRSKVASRKTSQLENRVEPNYKIESSKLNFAIVLLTIMGLAGYYLFVSSSGGLSFLFQNIIFRNQLRTTEYYRLLFGFAQTANWLWFASDEQATTKPLYWIHYFINLLCLISLGNRGITILFVVFLLILSELRQSGNTVSNARYLYQRFSKLFLFVIVFFSIGLGVLAWRRASIQAVRGNEFTVASIRENFVSLLDSEQLVNFLAGAGNLASIEAVATIVEAVPEKVPLLWGQSFYWLLLSPIPRVIWPDKPTTLGIVLKRILLDPNAEGGGVPPSWIGDLFLNFHVVGVVIGCLFFGFLAARTYRYFLTNRHRFFVQVFYVNFLVYFVFNLTKTEFRTAVVRFLGFFASLALAYLISRVKNVSYSKSSFKTAHVKNYSRK